MVILNYNDRNPIPQQSKKCYYAYVSFRINVESGGPPRNRTELQGFAVLCITNLPAGRINVFPNYTRFSSQFHHKEVGDAHPKISIRKIPMYD